MSNPGAAFLREDGGDRGPYDEVDGELLHHEVRSLLQKLHAGPIVTARPDALGDGRDGNVVAARGVRAH